MSNLTRVAVLEGVEQAGKTTIAEELVKRGWGYVHFKHETHQDRLVEWLTEIERVAREESADGRVVVDRLHYSSIVYGNLVRGYPDINDFDAWVMEGWRHSRGGYVYHVLPRDWAPSNRKLQERFQGMVSVRGIIDSYKWLFARLRVHEQDVYSLSTTARDIDRQLKPLAPVTDQSMGSRSPTQWLVGFQHNLSPRAREHYRLGTSFSGGCGVHLHRAMRVAKLYWRQTHVSNAYDNEDNLRNLHAKWLELGRPKVVGLGRQASEALTISKVPHAEVVHPQYARRFRRYDVVGYAREIRDAIKTVST